MKILDTFTELEGELEAELQLRQKQYKYYLNKLVYLTERERTVQIIRPILRGRDIKRYVYEWAGKWVNSTGLNPYHYAD
ncbi:hypothetical protein Q5I06_08710 [Helicobacter sp. faydin-H76]|uniref:Restriction endonuclease subunit S n=1 Tax=Helicobacter cappadocius TaxID=3063998 RepID=A0AA90PRW0_9HELI|nr:hypothetical protein [Helicobacter sp. faydin-H76]MDP2539846.1 hypothetical protein [Helicobacter sp. faydin-H76]